MYTITILDCLRAVNKAKRAGFFEFDDFDCEEYEHYERVQVWYSLPKFPFFYKDLHLLFHEADMYDRPLACKKVYERRSKSKTLIHGSARTVSCLLIFASLLKFVLSEALNGFFPEFLFF